MKQKLTYVSVERVETLIRIIRGQKVILDSDLARIYDVTTARLNQQVKRNQERFPEDFVFRLTESEHENLMLQFATSSSGYGGRRKLPYAFTEHGAIMAANVLNSNRAAQMSVFVVRAFVKMREVLAQNKVLADKLAELERKLADRLDVHEKAIVHILHELRKLMNPARDQSRHPNRSVFTCANDEQSTARNRGQLPDKSATMNLLAFSVTGFGMADDRPICAVWLTLFAPLVAAVLIALFTQRWKGLSALLSVGAIVLGFVLSLRLFIALAFHGQQHWPHSLQWLTVGNVRIEFGMVTDPLAILMLLVVTGVGSAIHIYSLGYMKGDPGFSRFFACMSLFTFSMLGIVIANNFIQTFIFWELVGLSSYLLIGFWFEKHSAAEAGKKAFLVNRVGDFGMMLGILLLWSLTGTFNFAELPGRVAQIPAGTLALIGALIFCGAVGKSAQVPLHVWLPDAMEGPTPVSALIHAATMVAAGVYMLCRVSFLILPSATALSLIAWVGGITAIMAATIAIAQNDIKRILAYSTLSQLGYMVMAVGLGGPTAAMFHLTTHAFFKALLFLGAGSVILALHHEQDIWKMGGLWKKTPITFWTFLIGTLALAGVFPFSGFYSKDEILLLAWNKNICLFIIGTFTAFLTAYYMGRECFVVFFGKPRDQHAYDHAHESPWVMTLPLILLAVFSIVAGWNGEVPHFLDPHGEVEHSNLGWALLLVPLAGFLVAAKIYWKAEPSDAPVEAALGKIWTVVENKYYFDELYLWIVKYVQGTIATTCELFDRWILQRLGIGGLSVGTGLLGRTVRLLQTGSISGYAFLVGLGVTVIIYYVVVR